MLSSSSAETFPHSRILDQHAALPVDREREQVAVAEAVANSNGFCRRRCRGREVARSLLLEHDRQQQEAVLSAGVLVLEKPLCTAEPAGCGADLTPCCEIQADPDRAPGSASRLANLEVAMVCALEPRDRLLVAPQHEGGRREQVEVARGQSFGAI